MALTPLQIEIIDTDGAPVEGAPLEVRHELTGVTASYYDRGGTVVTGVETDAAGAAQVWLPNGIYEWRTTSPFLTDWRAFRAYAGRGREGMWGGSPALTGSPAVDMVTIPVADVEDVAYGLELMLDLAHDALIDLRVELQQDSDLPILVVSQGLFQWTRTLPSPPADPYDGIWKAFRVHYGATNEYEVSATIGSFNLTDAALGNPAATTQGITVSDQAFESNYFWVEYLNDEAYPVEDQLTAVEGPFQGGPTDRVYPVSTGCFRNQAFDGTVYLSSQSGTDDPFFASSIVDGGHYGVTGLNSTFTPLSGDWTLTITDYGDSGSLTLAAWHLESLTI